MICPKCGEHINELENYCSKCGYKFRENTRGYEKRVENAFEEIKDLTILFFKNPTALVNKAINSSHNTGFVLAAMALILVSITALLWSLKSGSIFNVIVNVTNVAGAMVSQIITYALITVALYLFIKDKFNNILDIFTIVSIAYLPLVILRFLSNIVQIVTVISVIPIGAALSTAGVAAFVIIMYRILTNNKLIDENKAFFIVILIAFLC